MRQRIGVAARTVAERGPLSTRAISPKNSPGPSIRFPADASTSAWPSRMTKKSPPLSPFLQRTRPAGKSISSTRVRMKRSSSSLQPAKSGTARSRATRASATRAVYPRLCDALPRGVDLADERRAHPVGELALVIGVEDQQVGTASGDEGAGPSAATERVCRVDRRADDRLVRREAAERDPEGDRRGHAFDRRGARVVIRRERDGDACRDEAPGIGRGVPDEERAPRQQHRGRLGAGERAKSLRGG